ncbi:MAG: hypothetical protein JXR76_05180 [Deltaproteobacteria bacterium]|nr:hypothetical protein [Deltaproteobacteria bacterium]
MHAARILLLSLMAIFSGCRVDTDGYTFVSGDTQTEVGTTSDNADVKGADTDTNSDSIANIFDTETLVEPNDSGNTNTESSDNGSSDVDTSFDSDELLIQDTSSVSATGTSDTEDITSALDTGTNAEVTLDSDSDTVNLRCDPSKPFRTPIRLPAVSSDNLYDFPVLTWDGLTMYIFHNEVEPIRSSTRDSINGTFGAPGDTPELDAINIWLTGAQSSTIGNVSADGLKMYFGWGGQGITLLFETTRFDTESVFSTPEKVMNTSTLDAITVTRPVLSYNGERLYHGVSDLVVLTKTAGGFSNQKYLSTINSESKDGFPVVSFDELTIFWSTDRTDGDVQGKTDIWCATRGSVADDFSNPYPLKELNSSEWESPAWISMDGCEMYLNRYNPLNDTYDIFMAKRPL